MEEIRYAFPNFVPNQVLSSGQLNALRDYLDQQDRLSRVQLSGTGIACGLAVERLGAAGPLTLSEGFGISSEGYLFGLPGGRYTHYRRYRDPGVDEDGVPDYVPWRQRPALDKQIELFELLLEQEDPTTDKVLSAQQLKDRVVVVYLEISQQDLRTCLVTDCNNKGENLLLTPRLLLLKADDLVRLSGCGPAPERVDVPRLHTAIPLIKIQTTEELNGGYAAIIEDVAPTLVSALKEGLDRYGDALGLEAADAGVVDEFARNIRKALQQGRANQYLYDLVCDLATAYNEFIEAACRWVPDCAQATDHPRHLMAGHLGKAKGYRHHFRPAPTRSHWHGDLLRCERLLRRLLLLLESISLAPTKRLVLTPSHGEHAPLGDRAVPHYFKLGGEAEPLWRPDDCCMPGSPWSFRDGDAQFDIHYRRCSLQRIEGHLGHGWSSAQQKIAALRLHHNADFDLLVLYLEGPGKREREALEAVFEERRKLRNAESEFIEYVDKAISKENLQPAVFKTGYAAKASEVMASRGRVLESEAQWLQTREERLPLCNLGHLEADYGALRLEILCVLYRLRAALEALSHNWMPALENVADAVREAGIKEAGENYVALNKRITAEADAVKRAELEHERNAAESLIVSLEAENRLYMTARKAAPQGMVMLAATDADEPAKVAARAWETMRALREGSVENTVQVAETVSVEGINKLIAGLIKQLPERLADFDLPAFSELAKQLTLDLITLRMMNLLKQVISISRSGIDQGSLSQRAAIIALGQALKLEEQDLQHMLLTVLHDCSHSRLAYLYHLYLHHRENDSSRFADFASRHPGMEHLAGVEKGGSFILVAETEAPDAPVVADFSLAGPITCCCPVPVDLCLPPVAMPEYRIVRLKRSKDGKRYEPVHLVIDVLANDYDPNQHADWRKGYSRKVELLSDKSELGASLEVDSLSGQVSYRMEEVAAGAVDRFRYRLDVTSGKCTGADSGDVLVLLVPEVNQQPILGRISGRVTWHKKGVAEAVIRIDDQPRTVTGSKGEFQIENLQPGDYSISAVLFGGEVVSEPQVVGVSAGGTATANFDLPVEAQSQLGELVVKVTDAKRKTVIKTATVVVVDARNNPVSRRDAADQQGLYSFVDIPAGTYRVGVNAEGYSPFISDGLLVSKGQRTLKSVALLAQKETFVPGKTRDVVIINERIPEKEATDKVSEVYTGRINKYVEEITAAADKEVVRDSDSYAKAREFVITTMQDPKLEEKDIIEAYGKVSKDLASAVESAGPEDKAEYQALLGSVSKSMLDRLAMENPAEVGEQAETAVVAMNDTLKSAGVDVARMTEEWQGEELGKALGVKSAGTVKRLAVRG